MPESEARSSCKNSNFFSDIGIRVGAARKKIDDGSGGNTVSSAAKFQSVGLVVGATSSVGSSLVEILPLSDTPGGPWKVYALSTTPLPSSSLAPSVKRLRCDLSNPDETLEILSPAAESITHIFYVDESATSTSSARLTNLLSAVLPTAKNLQHICLKTDRSHYLNHEPPFIEGLPRLDSPNPNYDLEDVLFKKIRDRNESLISWSVHRPTTIFGSTGLIKTICVYAAICKKERVPLRWPGSRAQWEGFSDASDADLVAEQQIWAAVDPYAKEEAFNCSNGDVFKWKTMWKILAEQFGVEPVGYKGEGRRFRLKEAMEGKDEVWEEIVKENELLPTKLGDVGNWGFVDEVFGAEECCLDSMNKSKEHGFLGFRNSVYSFTSWVDKLKSFKIVP